MTSARSGLLVAWICLCAASASAAQSSSSGRVNRVDRLAAWLNAVDGHRPGEVDGPVLEVRDWNGATLRLVWLDLRTLVSLIREPDVGIFFAPPEVPSGGNSPRSTPSTSGRQIFYSRAELRQLRRMAQDVSVRSGEDRILKRAAVLHADIAMLAPGSGQETRGSIPQGPERITLYMNDGQRSGLETAASRWEMGRRVLDIVRPAGSREARPNPGADPAVRAWYLAAAAAQQGVALWDPKHTDRSLALFPRDADVLFFAGCLHEALSGAQVQMAVQSANVPRDVVFDLGTEGAELREASSCSGAPSRPVRPIPKRASGWGGYWDSAAATRKPCASFDRLWSGRKRSCSSTSGICSWGPRGTRCRLPTMPDRRTSGPRLSIREHNHRASG